VETEGDSNSHFYLDDVSLEFSNPGSLVRCIALDISDDITPATISNITVEVVSADSVIIRWTTNEAADSEVAYGTLPGIYTAAESDHMLVTDHEIMLAGLSPSTTYYFVVRSADVAGNSSQSEEGTFTTDTGGLPLFMPIVPSRGQ
jgi:hypothetical protein